MIDPDTDDIAREDDEEIEDNPAELDEELDEDPIEPDEDVVALEIEELVVVTLDELVVVVAVLAVTLEDEEPLWVVDIEEEDVPGVTGQLLATGTISNVKSSTRISRSESSGLLQTEKTPISKSVVGAGNVLDSNL